MSMSMSMSIGIRKYVVIVTSVSRRNAAEPSPLYLYKYWPLDPGNSDSVNMARAILVHERTWVSPPAALNDPKDMRFKLVFNQDLATRERCAKENAHLLGRLSPAKRLVRQKQLARAS